MPDIKVTGATRSAAASAYLSKAFGGGAGAAAAYAADASEVSISGDSLQVLQALAEELLTEERAVAQCASELQKAVARLYDVQEKRLPDLMERNSLPKFDFLDRTTGLTVTIKFESNKWRVTLPALKDKQGDVYPDGEAKRERIYAWLREINLGAIIDKDMHVPLGLECDERVAQIVAAFKMTYPSLDPAVKEGVNQKRLQSQINNLLKDGKSVHEDLVVDPIRKATVVRK